MSGPKHLWSGDWQRESEAASSARAHRAPRESGPARDEPATEAPPRRRRRRLRLTGTAAFATAAVLVLAGVAFGLSSLLGSSPGRPRGNRPGGVASATVPTVPTVPGMPSVPQVPTSPMPAPVPAQPSPPTSTAPQTQTNPQTNPAAIQPTVNWLGMEIATQPPGAAVVQTVSIGSAGDRAGVNPGEIIQAVNGRPIHRAQDIPAVLHGLSRGDRVTLQLVYGSSSSRAQLTLGAPPSVAP